MSVHKEAWVQVLAADTDIRRMERDLQQDSSLLPKAVALLARNGWDKSPALLKTMVDIEEADDGVLLEALQELYGGNLQGFKLPKGLWSSMDWKYTLSWFPESAMPTVTYRQFWEVITELSAQEGDYAASGGYDENGYRILDPRNTATETVSLEDFISDFQFWELSGSEDHLENIDDRLDDFTIEEDGEIVLLEDVLEFKDMIFMTDDSEVSIEDYLKVMGLSNS